MKKRELINPGLAPGRQLDAARRAVEAGARAGMDHQAVRRALRQLVREPDAYLGHPQFGALAEVLAGRPRRPERTDPVACRQESRDDPVGSGQGG